MQDTLSKALGIKGIVKKTRTLYMVGQTRVHVDQVEGLGNFMELEVEYIRLKIRPYKEKILVLRHRCALKIPPDETFLSWEGKKIAAARQISHADKYNFL